MINLLAALAGWVAFNVVMLSMYKDEHEQTFNLSSYAKEYWDNWLASFVMIPVLLYFGYKQLGLGLIEMEHVKWSDAYYVCSGFAVELIKEVYKKWKSK